MTEATHHPTTLPQRIKTTTKKKEADLARLQAKKKTEIQVSCSNLAASPYYHQIGAQIRMRARAAVPGLGVAGLVNQAAKMTQIYTSNHTPLNALKAPNSVRGNPEAIGWTPSNAEYPAPAPAPPNPSREQTLIPLAPLRYAIQLQGLEATKRHLCLPCHQNGRKRLGWRKEKLGCCRRWRMK
jgi:hypothetical protein